MDKQNRQHMEHMRQYGGDSYGGGQQQHYPYGMPPMMMGMPPMGYGVCRYSSLLAMTVY